MSEYIRKQKKEDNSGMQLTSAVGNTIIKFALANWWIGLYLMMKMSVVVQISQANFWGTIDENWHKTLSSIRSTNSDPLKLVGLSILQHTVEIEWTGSFPLR